VIVVMLTKSWVPAPCGSVGRYQRFELSPSSGLMLQDRAVEGLYRMRGATAEGRDVVRTNKDGEGGYPECLDSCRYRVYLLSLLPGLTEGKPRTLVQSISYINQWLILVWKSGRVE
jgi:hypothetical protein